MIRINYGKHVTILRRNLPQQIIYFGDIHDMLFTRYGSWIPTRVEFAFCLN